MANAAICAVIDGMMRLYIGKNHQESATPAQSIFRLAGNGEDALTFAFGFLLAHDPAFCAELVRRLHLAGHNPLKPGYSVHLQEVTDRRFGRRDIVIEDGEMRIVFEAKIGGAEPTAEQLLKYGAESNLWNKYKLRAVVALTQVELAPSTREQVRAKLAEQNIGFYEIRWHEIVDLVLSHSPSNDSAVSNYLFDEFTHYIRSDYRMGYYDAEILIQDVNPLNAEIFRKCWMYVTDPKRDKKAPLYFAPYFTRRGANSGISMVSRVMDTRIVVLAETANLPVPATDEYRVRWEDGLTRLRERAEQEGFAHNEVRLFFLDRPIIFPATPLTKKASKSTGGSKQIPNQIPKGFSLGFDDLLRE